MSSLVKQFLHFTRAPLAFVHPNVIQILIGCCILNLLYQLDLSLVEVYFAYTLRVAQGGRMSMSAQSPWLQFVTGLLDSPKSEAKGVILVRGPWDETLGTPDLPFDVNHSMFFQVRTSNGAYLLMYFSYAHSCTRVSLLWVVYAGKSRRDKLVHWVERANFAKIRRLLEIFEHKRHHEVLLTVKNLHDLSRHPSSYSVPIILRPLPS